ncbi:MAG: response regulator [Labilibaculum sp.]|nr:response regulator [Labilibaculum sp.]
MMIRSFLRRLSCTFIFVVFFFHLFGLSPVRFQQITTEDGLSNNTILSIDQDHFGRIWFATYDGLTCFDGIGYHIFHHIPLQVGNTIPNCKAEQILVDSIGNVWALFENNELIRIEGNQGGCISYSHLQDGSNSSVELALDKDGMLLLISNETNFKYIPEKDDFIPYQLTDFKKRSELIADIQKKLEQIIPDVKVFSFYKSTKDHSLWISTLNYGIFEIPNGDYSKAINYQDSAKDTYCISCNEVYCIFVDRSGNVWAGTKDGGVNRSFVTGNSFRAYLHNNNSENTIPSGTIRAVYKEKNGKLWIGTYNKGIAVLNKDVYSYIKFSKEKQSDKWDWIRCIYQTSDGYIWVGTYAGLCRIHPETMEKKYFDPGLGKNSISKGRIYSITEDAKGNLFIGEWGSIDYFDRKENTFTRIDTISNLEGKNIRKLLLSMDGRLWIGTESSGVSVIDTSNFKLINHYQNNVGCLNSINSNSIFDIYEDKTGTIWVGSFGGLNSISNTGTINNFYVINKSLQSTLIYKIYEDEKENLWCSTAKGIVRIKKKTQQIRVYDKSDGCLIFEFSEGAGYQDCYGNLFFGGGNGLSYFHPDSIATISNVPTVLLESVLVNEISLAIPYLASGQDSSFQFSAWENDLSFDIKSIMINSSGKNKIAWKLIPFDEEFQLVDGSVSKPKYFHLASGEYKLLVKSANADDVWSDTKQVFSFEIAKPFWMEIYFFISLACFVGLCIIFVSRFRLIQIKQRNQHLEGVVLRRTQKIENQKQDLERTNKVLEDRNAKVLAQKDQILAQRDHLLEMHNKLEELNRLKQNFFTNISHDIRTPLSLIVAPLSEMLQNKNLPLELIPKLQCMQTNSTYILQLLNQVLDKKKLEVGGLQLIFTQGDIIRAFKSTVNSFTDQVKSNGLNLSFSSNKESYSSRYDYDKLQQILFNLLANAIKFTPFGGKVACRLSFNNDGFEFSVADTGIGIPSDRIQHIFDRYYQVGKSLQAENQGVGIGLSLVNDFVKLLKGAVCVESEEEQGSKFTVRLPFLCNGKTGNIYSVTDVEDRKVENIEDSSANVNSHSLNKELILLVEDNCDLREYLTDILSGKYRVVAVENGCDAMRYLKKNCSVSLILSDWMMPKMDGIELCKMVKKKGRYQTIPFILLTALSEINNQKEGYWAGIDEFVSKPFDPELLFVKISNLIKRNKQIRKAARVNEIIKPENKQVKTFDEKLIEKLKTLVEEQISNSAFGQSELAKGLGMSQMQLYRKLKDLLQMAPNEFIRTIRIKRAIQLLEKEGFTINEVSYMVGFNDPKYFSRCFTKELGTSPSKFRLSKLVP